MTLTLEQQVCSLKYSKRFRELGVPQESQFYWRVFGVQHNEYELCYNSRGNMELEPFSAFTVAELADWQKESDEPQPWYANGLWWWYRGEETMSEKTQADAYAARGVYLLESKLI